MVTVPAPQHSLTFSVGVEALRRIEDQRQAREDRMRNALEILEGSWFPPFTEVEPMRRFVRRTAREGLGRE